MEARHLEAKAVTAGQPHFFGYYDKCPWSPDGKRLLAMRAPFQDRPPTENDPLTVGAVDLAAGRYEPFAETTAWCWQQGTMLRWLSDDAVIYNARQDGRLVSVVHDLNTGKRRTLPRAVYDVHPNGAEAVSLDFHRLQTLRPGYGYPPAREISQRNLIPDDVGLWRVDLRTGDERLLYSIAQAQAHQPHPDSHGVPNWVNHATYNTDGTRFCFLHRFNSDINWTGGFATRLFTLGSDGRDPYILNPHDQTSHFAWRDPAHLLAWCRRRPGDKSTDAYYLLRDRAGTAEKLGEGVLARDGHMTYSPDLCWVLTDEYPHPSDKCQPLLLYEVATGRRIEVGRFAAPLSGELRCDLHPRWNRDGTQVCFDSAHSGTRQVYVMDVSSIVRP